MQKLLKQNWIKNSYSTVICYLTHDWLLSEHQSNANRKYAQLTRKSQFQFRNFLNNLIFPVMVIMFAWTWSFIWNVYQCFNPFADHLMPTFPSLFHPSEYPVSSTHFKPTHYINPSTKINFTRLIQVTSLLNPPPKVKLRRKVKRRKNPSTLALRRKLLSEKKRFFFLCSILSALTRV